jgi:hypothetical protein
MQPVCRYAAFDTVVLAVGRYAVTQGLNLPAGGVEFNPKNGKIPAADEVGGPAHTQKSGSRKLTQEQRTTSYSYFLQPDRLCTALTFIHESDPRY